jgi:hypothetical protein
MYAEPKLGSPANIFWIALATIGVLAWCFGPQTWDWYQAKKMGESQPCLRLGVQPLVIADADVASGTKEAFFGYEFEVPWPSVDAKVIRQIATVTTGNGPGLVFWNPADRRQLFDSTRKWTHPNTRDALGSILGKDAARSNYDLIEQYSTLRQNRSRPLCQNEKQMGG